MDDELKNAVLDTLCEADRSGAVAQGLEALREEVDGLTRVEQAVLATCLGYEIAKEVFVRLEALEGEDGRAWRWLCGRIGLRILPDGTPQAWAGETLPPPEEEDGTCGFYAVEVKPPVQ